MGVLYVGWMNIVVETKMCMKVEKEKIPVGEVGSIIFTWIVSPMCLSSMTLYSVVF